MVMTRAQQRRYQHMAAAPEAPPPRGPRRGGYVSLVVQLIVTGAMAWCATVLVSVCLATQHTPLLAVLMGALSGRLLLAVATAPLVVWGKRE